MSRLNPQNQILKALSGRKPVSIKSIKVTEKAPEKAKYALSRAIKNLVSNGMAELLSSENEEYLRLTNEGKQKLNSIELDQGTMIMPGAWDGKWRIVILDLPESRKSEREAIRYLLKKAGFVCLKNSMWISPFQFEYFIENIKKDLNFTNELMIIVTDKIDESTEKYFLQNFGK